VLTTTDDEPKSVRKATKSVERKLSKDTMVKKMESLHNNETWNLVKLTNGINHVGSKWVFKKNMNETGQVKKFKSRLVANEYFQVEGVEFSAIFSLVAKLSSIRVPMNLATTIDMEI